MEKVCHQTTIGKADKGVFRNLDREDFTASMWSVPALLWFTVGISCDTSPIITQKPLTVVGWPGSNISLDCSLEGHSNPNFYWVRQIPGGSMETLFYSVNKGSVETTGPGHIKASRPEDNRFELSIPSLTADDTGMYFCAWSLTLCQAGAAP